MTGKKEEKNKGHTAKTYTVYKLHVSKTFGLAFVVAGQPNTGYLPTLPDRDNTHDNNTNQWLTLNDTKHSVQQLFQAFKCAGIKKENIQ